MFRKEVLNFIKSVPAGKVVSYGQVALMCGKPRGAREVGWILRSINEDSGVPWWRVVNNMGKISISGHEPLDKNVQASLLHADGVVVSEDFTLDIKKYRHLPL